MTALTTSRLQEIAKTVKTEHAKIEGIFREGLTRAIEVGKLLNEAKGLVKHGEWGKWIADNCNFSDRTAQSYMRVASRYPELTKAQPVADFTYREAVALLAEPKADEPRIMTTVERVEQFPAPDGLDLMLGDDKAAAYKQIRCAHDEGWIRLTPTSLEIMPKLEEAGRVDVFWIGLMAEMFILIGKRGTNASDSVQWWIGDLLVYAEQKLPNYKECLKKAEIGAVLLQDILAKKLLEELKPEETKPLTAEQREQ